MGHHRYQVGFSGDVAALTWSNLAYQPYFSATAANVLFPSWSHDIEGAWYGARVVRVRLGVRVRVKG